MKLINCAVCGSEFEKKKKTSKYCSHSCFGKANRPIGTEPWNKGIKGIHLSPKSEFKKGVTPKNSMVFKSSEVSFKGTISEYKAIHHWVGKNKGKPTQCEHCKNHYTGRKIHWANISGEYKKELSDWIRLCAKCHYEFDGHSQRKERNAA
jgi:hypothetical protein